ncbi:MAG TPA: transposase [Gaiellales bacterium]|nr:transposase [Gaiellales bacterium]
MGSVPCAGLAPGSYQSATINRRTPISRQRLPEHRDALMNLAWGLSQHCGPFIDRHHELRARGLRPIPARIALARHACRLAYTLIGLCQRSWTGPRVDHAAAVAAVR